MYLSELLMSCLRRWPIFLVCLLVSGGLFYQAAQAVKPTYAAEASVVLVPPTSTENPDINRYLGLGGLKQSVDVLVSSMTSDRTTRELQKQVPGADFELVSDIATSAPIVLVTATSKTPGPAEAMMRAVLARLPSTLDQLQVAVSIAPQSRITQMVLSSAQKPKTVEKTRYRLLGVVGIGLLLASGLFVAAVDGLLLRRARRRATDEDDGSGDGSEATVHAPPRITSTVTTGLTSAMTSSGPNGVTVPVTSGAAPEHAPARASSTEADSESPETRRPTPSQTARSRRPAAAARRTS